MLIRDTRLTQRATVDGNRQTPSPLADGRCRIDDGYERLILEYVVPADALVIATPLYYYGMAGRLKVRGDMGRRLFDIRVTDYRMDTERSNRVWG